MTGGNISMGDGERKDGGRERERRVQNRGRDDKERNIAFWREMGEPKEELKKAREKYQETKKDAMEERERDDGWRINGEKQTDEM